MPVFPIRTFGDPVLRQPAAPVAEIDGSVKRLVRDMFDTMYAAPGVGLAAPQIGVSRRVIVWDAGGNRGSFVNPELVASEGEDVDDEACLSLPGLTYPVTRAAWVKVAGLSPDGEVLQIEAEDYQARILQHEIDHINGVLFIDRLSPEHQREAKKRLREQVMGHSPQPQVKAAAI